MRNLYYAPKSVFQMPDYSDFQKEFTSFHNSGNKLFQYSIEKYLYENGVEYDCGGYEIDYINNSYERVIISPANILGSHAKDRLRNYYNLIKKIKIPVIFLSIGVQKKIDTTCNELKNKIGYETKKLIEAVYNTGGEFGLRGYITKEFFDTVFPDNTAVVTGCPSMYMNKNLYVTNNKVEYKKFKPLINGTMSYLKQNNFYNIFEEYKNAEYIDQDEFADILLYKNSDEKNILNLLLKYSYTGIKLLSENRLKFFYDICSWMDYIKESGFNFSFGSRIHGSIMPILCGVPAVVDCQDSRTYEICDFYSIPKYKNNKKLNLYNEYINTDYTKFNLNYQKNYEIYRNFMRSCGLCPKNDYALKEIETERVNIFDYYNNLSFLKENIEKFSTEKYAKKINFFNFMHMITIGKLRKKYKNQYKLAQECLSILKN